MSKKKRNKRVKKAQAPKRTTQKAGSRPLAQSTPRSASQSALLSAPEETEVPPPTIEGLSERSQRALTELAQAQAQGASHLDSDAVELALTALKSDLEGQALGLLEETLDWIRDAGLYDLSLPLLEEAWSSELPEDFLGRVAQDWVGSVLFGLADEEGALEVAGHLTARARELGPSFASDLCDLWLEWGLFEVAEDLARFVHERQPGEVSALFHLMICAKMKSDWGAVREWLELIDNRRLGADVQADPALEWNRGVLAVAERRWRDARQAWERVGFNFPEELDAIDQDYAQPGELSPVRLKLDLTLVSASQGALPRSEVVWGRRVGPARVELTGLPYYHPTYRCGDILLVDGVREGQVDFNGDKYPISPALEVWESSPGETLRFYGAHSRLKQTMTLDRLAQTLGERGWAIAHWTRFARRETPSGDQLLQLAIYLPPDRDLSAVTHELKQLWESGHLPPLYCPRYAELTGASVDEHREALIDLGVIEH